MSRKTAFLVIHGIGEQEPYETLDAFARPFFQQYADGAAAKGQPEIRRRHTLRRMNDWIESFVAVESPGQVQPAADIYEYYWSHLTQRQITAGEILDWILTVADGAKSFYQTREGLMAAAPRNTVLFEKDGEFRHYEYLVRILGITHRFKGILQPLFERLRSQNWFLNVMARLVNRPLVDFLGDVTLYCTTDVKSAHYDVRRKILAGALDKARALLVDDQYDEVVFVGHSLGTVIAYDVLDRLNKEMNVDESLRARAGKLKGLVTFGSPLDKIAFFFDEKINQKKQAVRFSLVSQLHGFRRVNVDTTTLENGVTQYFQDVRWINFWTKPDPVSGHLDVYHGVENIELDFTDKITSPVSIAAHSLYWDDPRMYQQILKTFGIIS